MTSGTSAKAPLRSFWHDLPREGKLLLSIVVVDFVGNGLVLPFWVVYLHEVRQVPLGTAGTLIGLEALAGLLAVGPIGTLIDRYGARLILVTGNLLGMAGLVLMAFASTPALLAPAFVLIGIGLGGAWPSVQTLVATIVPADIRQRYFGVNFTLLNLGIGIGGVIGGLFVDVDRTWTFQTIYLVDALTFLAPLYVLLVPLRHVRGAPEHDAETTPKAGYRDVLRLPGIPTIMVLGFVSSFVGYAQLNSGMPAFARFVARVSTTGLGLAFAGNTLVIVLLQLVVLRRIEGRRRTRVMVAMAALWALAWLLMGAAGLVPGTLGATVLIAACASVFALGETLLQPTMPAMINDLATDRLRGRTNALSSACFNLPQVVAPPVAGWLIGHHLQAIYVVVLVVGCAVVALLSVVRLEPVLTPQANGLTLAEPPPPSADPVAGVPAAPQAEVD